MCIDPTFGTRPAKLWRHNAKYYLVSYFYLAKKMNNKVADFVGNILMIKIISQQLLYSKDNIDEKYIASETQTILIFTVRKPCTIVLYFLCWLYWANFVRICYFWINDSSKSLWCCILLWTIWSHQNNSFSFFFSLSFFIVSFISCALTMIYVHSNQKVSQ